MGLTFGGDEGFGEEKQRCLETVAEYGETRNNAANQ